MKKNKKITIVLIIFLTILAIAIISLMVTMITRKNKNWNFNIFNKDSSQLVLDKIYNTNFNNINIYSSDGNIYIKESSNNDVRIVIYGNKENTKVSTDNQNLSIEIENNKCYGFCFNNTISKIEVYLPKEYANLIKIVNDYGDIQIGNFKNATIDIEEESGDIFIMNANIIKARNKYGDIKINETIQANIYASSGDINIDFVNDAIVKNEYGKIAIENIYNYLDLNNNSGDIIIKNIILNKDSIIKDEYGDIEIQKTNDIYINARSDLGDVKIKNNNRKSDVTLSIENNNGDITINN